MTDIAIASTALHDRGAGQDLASQIRAERHGGSPDAVIVFGQGSVFTVTLDRVS